MRRFQGLIVIVMMIIMGSNSGCGSRHNDTEAAVAASPVLTLMVSTGTDSIQMAWTSGSDGKLAEDKVTYNIYLSTDENFVPSSTNLKKSLIGKNQTKITGLSTDTLYYGKIRAVYSATNSDTSNTLQSKTYKTAVTVNTSRILEKAEDLGLGKYSTTDGLVYTFAGGGTAPATGSIFISENVDGGMTLRNVDSSYSSGGKIIVETSDASLTDILDSGSIYSSFKLFDVTSKAKSLTSQNSRILRSTSMVDANGTQVDSISWNDDLLYVQQDNYAYKSDELNVSSKNNVSKIMLKAAQSVNQSFTATVSTNFEPELITSAEWGATLAGGLDSAHVAAIGTLSLTAEAQYNFSAAGDVENEFQLFSRNWTVFYYVGTVPVYQEITLSVDVKVSASALAKLQADATSTLSETVEVGATYDGNNWIPYINHGESDSLTASLDIVGKANAEIRVIPKITVGFYRVISADLSVEPLASSSLDFGTVTNNIDFLAAHPNRLVDIKAFDNLLGMESNIGVTLGTLGHTWDILPSTCILGTGDCLYGFSPVKLFSIPSFSLSQTGTLANDDIELSMTATDGVHNEFDPATIEWEVFPDDATIESNSCVRSTNTTTCSATLTPGENGTYDVFASGYGILGEIARQYVDLEVEVTNCVYWQCYWPGEYIDDTPGPTSYTPDQYEFGQSCKVADNIVVNTVSEWSVPKTEDDMISKSWEQYDTSPHIELYEGGENDACSGSMWMGSYSADNYSCSTTWEPDGTLLGNSCYPEMEYPGSCHNKETCTQD